MLLFGREVPKIEKSSLGSHESSDGGTAQDKFYNDEAAIYPQKSAFNWKQNVDEPETPDGKRKEEAHDHESYHLWEIFTNISGEAKVQSWNFD
mmetsp:Transcript_61007/g.69823  ORF Transcript_61007/g.69823 Transcript_61007/m.69823 type:complete len:93 (+) Transcript_61007:472-750(+)